MWPPQTAGARARNPSGVPAEATEELARERVFAVCEDALFVVQGADVPRAEKIERVAELRDRIRVSDALLLTEYRGLSVSDIAELRRALSESGARFAVVKNTLMRRAAVDASVPELEALLEGPTAVAFIAGDPVAAAKKVVEAQRKYPSLALKGGYMEGRVLLAEEATALADLESREVMLSKVAGMLKGEMARAASMFQTPQSRFVGILEAYKEKFPDEPPEPTGLAEPSGPTEPSGPAEPARQDVPEERAPETEE